MQRAMWVGLEGDPTGWEGDAGAATSWGGDATSGGGDGCLFGGLLDTTCVSVVGHPLL